VKPWSVPFGVLVGAVALCGIGAAARTAPAAARHLGRGEALFVGEEPLKGAIRGHRSGLPPEVVRCSNCHAVRGEAQRAGTLAPRIDRALLLEVRDRRGGPPSAYDPPSFCKLMRTGVDPVYIVIAREMPVYDLDDAQCASLWQFLTAETKRTERSERNERSDSGERK
jgi:hypothetical protein